MQLVNQRSWGRVTTAQHEIIRLAHRLSRLDHLPKARSWLAFGNGRSYGDSCLNDGGLVFHTRGLNRFLAFDTETGIIACEAGALLSEIVALVVPRQWFLPVTPGTQFVTVGGALANDVHGKNHHQAGSFGAHVLRFELLRSTGERLLCSRALNPDLFYATIGGLGLTGVVQWVELKLVRMPSPVLDVETIRFQSLDEFFLLCAESDLTHEYTVAWIDALARSRNGPRGHFIRASIMREPARAHFHAPARQYSIPVDPPWSLVNRATVRIFNTAYYHRHSARRRSAQHFASFFYPLDRLGNWNRLYGKRGFFQFQCVVPTADAERTLAEIFRVIQASGETSFLTVLKRFGTVQAPGMLSFARPGFTLALDFPNCGASTLALLGRLEDITMAAGGAIYPAKDQRMSAAAFHRSFPNLPTFRKFVDPQFSSGLWRRVNG